MTHTIHLEIAREDIKHVFFLTSGQMIQTVWEGKCTNQGCGINVTGPYLDWIKNWCKEKSKEDCKYGISGTLKAMLMAKL